MEGGAAVAVSPSWGVLVVVLVVGLLAGWVGRGIIGAAAKRAWWWRGGGSGGGGTSGGPGRPTNVPMLALVNPRSGGGLGAALMAALERLPDPVEVHPLSHDGLAAVVRRLRALRASHMQPRLICAGGDGTVTAVTRVLSDRGLTSVPIAVLPLGTGNDCAQTLRMGLPAFTPVALNAWVAAAAHGRVIATDVFDVAFDTYPAGSIVVVRNKVETQLAEREVRGTCVMYSSVGADSRCVYTVELNRMPHRLLNKVGRRGEGGGWEIVAAHCDTLHGWGPVARVLPVGTRVLPR